MTATTADAPPPELRLPKRRGVELTLLIAAVLISVYGYAAVGLARNGVVPPDVAGYGGGLGLLALLAHLAVRFRAPYADPLLLPIAVLLNGLGLVLIYRLDLETPRTRRPPPSWSGPRSASRSSSRSWCSCATTGCSSGTPTSRSPPPSS